MIVSAEASFLSPPNLIPQAYSAGLNLQLSALTEHKNLQVRCIMPP